MKTPKETAALIKAEFGDEEVNRASRLPRILDDFLTRIGKQDDLDYRSAVREELQRGRTRRVS
jgi:hypothetical protein